MARPIDDGKIFAATVDALLAHGYAGATTKTIAHAAGVNEVTLFRKYGSKAQLVTAALLHERAQMVGQEIAFSGDLRAGTKRIV